MKNPDNSCTHAPHVLDGRLSPPSLPQLRLKRNGFGDGTLKRLEEPGQIVGVFAPAGYAKTSLLRSLHTDLTSRSRAVAWLSLGGDVNSPEAFLDYVTAALIRAGVMLDTVQISLPTLLNTLTRRSEPLTLLLDNVEQLRQAECLSILDQFLDGLPPTVRVVLAGRCNPGLRFSALMASRRLRLIEPTELAFSFAETAEFLIRETGETLSAAALNDIYEQTQGWPGLLSVLISSFGNDDSLENLLRDGRLPQRQLSTYVAEEVLGQLTSTERAALEVLSLAPQVDQQLIAFLIDQSTCPSLDLLSRRNPLIRALKNGTFTTHPAVRQCLRASMASEDRTRFAALCRRLAEWFRDHGDAASAIDYLIDSGDLAEASALLETQGRNIALEGFPDRCLSWLARLHPEHLDRHPGLQLTEVWARVTMHETDAASELLNSARLRSAKRRNPNFGIEVMTATAFSHAIADRPKETLAAVEAVPQSARELSVTVRAGCSSVEAWYQFSRGQFDEARNTLYRTAGLEMQGQGLLIHAYASIVSGESYAAEGHIGTAEAIFRRAVRMAEDRRGRRSMVVVVALGPLLEVLYEADRIDEVLALASGRSRLRLKYSTPGSSSAAGVALAHSLILRNAPNEASELLEDMTRVGEESHLPRIVAHALAARIQIALNAGEAHEIAEMSGRLDALRRDEAGLLGSPQGVINFLSRISHARVLSYRNNHEAAYREMKSLSDELAPLPWRRVQLQVDTALAVVLWQSGETEKAIQALAGVISQAAPFGLVRSLVDQFVDRAMIESSDLRRIVPAPLHPYLDRLKAAMTGSLPTAHPETRVILPGSGWTDATLSGQDPGFTTREREILFLLARGLSNKRIAQTLRIAAETAKWHTRNIYEKLGVHDRPSAQLAIRRLQLSEHSHSPKSC